MLVNGGGRPALLRRLPGNGFADSLRRRSGSGWQRGLAA